jgi:hypothetical protein
MVLDGMSWGHRAQTGPWRPRRSRTTLQRRPCTSTHSLPSESRLVSRRRRYAPLERGAKRHEPAREVIRVRQLAPACERLDESAGRGSRRQRKMKKTPNRSRSRRGLLGPCAVGGRHPSKAARRRPCEHQRSACGEGSLVQEVGEPGSAAYPVCERCEGTECTRE